MKYRPLLFALATSLPLAADDFQWDTNGATLGLGGAGTWDASNAFWDAIASGFNDGTDTPAAYAFTTSDKAIFGGTAGIVTLGTGGVTANAIQFDTTGYSITGETLTLGGSTPTITTASGVSATISSILAGSADWTKAGAGTLVLSGPNTYSGKTTIIGGTLSIDADSRLGTAPGAAVADQLTLNGGTLAITSATSLNANRGITLGASGGTFDTSSQGTGNTSTLSGIIAGTGPLMLKANGDTSASGGGAGGLGIQLGNSANTFTGDITITSGLVTYAAEGSFGNAANKIILNGGGLLNNDNTNANLARNIEVQSGGGLIRLYGSVSATFSGALTGTGTLRHTDGGTLTLSGDLAGYSGTLNNQAGTLVINSAATQSAVLTGSGTFEKTGSGTLTLNGASSFSGQTNVYGATSSTLILASTSGPALTGNVYIGKPGNSGGILQLGADNQLTSSSTLTFGHAYSSARSYFKLNGFSTQIAGLANGTDLGGTVINGAATDSTLELAGTGTYTYGPISGYHGTIENGSTGKLNILKTGSGTQTFVGANTYTGTTTVNAGTLKAGASTTVFGNNSAVSIGNVAGATLDLAGYNVAIGSLAGGGATGGKVTLGAGTLTTGGNGASTTFAGVIEGSGGLTKSGGGTLTLAGANTYTGKTNITGGTLKVGIDNPFANSTSFAMSGGSLDLNGFSVTANNPGALTGGAVVRNTATATMATLNVNLAGNWSPGWITDTAVNAHLKLTGTGATPSKFTTSAGHNNWSAMTLDNAYTAGIPNDNANAAYTLNNGGLTASTSLTIPGTSSISLTGANNFLASTTAGQTLTVSSAITGDGGLAIGNATATNLGTVTLSGANDYTGNTMVNGGTLIVNGSLGNTSTTIGGSGTLKGNGSIGGAVGVNGTLAPGNSIGALNFSQTLTLAGIADFEIDPTLGLGLNSDLANVTGTVTYGGILNVLYGGSNTDFTNGMVFNLFDASSFTGSFSEVNLPDLTGTGLNWQDNLATNGTLTVVPEPSAGLLGGLGLLALLRRRRPQSAFPSKLGG